MVVLVVIVETEGSFGDVEVEEDGIEVIKLDIGTLRRQRRGRRRRGLEDETGSGVTKGIEEVYLNCLRDLVTD